MSALKKKSGPPTPRGTYKVQDCVLVGTEEGVGVNRYHVDLPIVLHKPSRELFLGVPTDRDQYHLIHTAVSEAQRKKLLNRKSIFLYEEFWAKEDKPAFNDARSVYLPPKLVKLLGEVKLPFRSETEVRDMRVPGLIGYCTWRGLGRVTQAIHNTLLPVIDVEIGKMLRHERNKAQSTMDYLHDIHHGCGYSVHDAGLDSHRMSEEYAERLIITECASISEANRIWQYQVNGERDATNTVRGLEKRIANLEKQLRAA